MNSTVKNLIDLGLFRTDQTPGNISGEARVVLRFLLEWQYNGRPKEREREFFDLMWQGEHAVVFTNYPAVTELTISREELDEIVDYLSDLFVNEQGQFEWIPYLWKGLIAHPKVDSTLVQSVKDVWETKPDAALFSLHVLFSTPSQMALKATFERIVSQSRHDGLKERAQQELEMISALAKNEARRSPT